MALPLVQRPQVFCDLQQAADYLARRSRPTAIRFLAAAERSFEFLQDNPHAGAIALHSALARIGLRVWPVKGFRRHLILYLVRQDAIEVVRVLHAAQDWEGEAILSAAPGSE